MKIARFLTLVSLFFSFQVHGRGYVIGNGGDGYSVDDSIFVTDLLEAGLERINLPKDGAISPRIARWRESSRNSTRARPALGIA
jgi:hypothetical protein